MSVKKFFPALFSFLFFFFGEICCIERPIVLLITSYNNSQWYKRNLNAAFAQEYDNFRIVYVDDCSPDGTGDLVEQYIIEKGWQDRVILVKNETRRMKMENFYRAVHDFCLDHEIVIDYDGDDWLFDEHVLSRINKAYENPEIWMTYGSYEMWPVSNDDCCKIVPKWVINEGAYREYIWVTSSLQTFYAWLLKKYGLMISSLMACLYQWLPIWPICFRC